MPQPTAENKRLNEHREMTTDWKLWGPYLSDRQWGTVREDYSPGGAAWDYFPHDHARSRAYRWGEDGLLGISDRKQLLCFGLGLWNEQDGILKERLFGLTGPEGNHGEDVKEYYYYLDSTPTHTYLKALYKYPQRAFPYGRLVEESRKRSRTDSEFELMDTGVFDDNRYFDVFVEYAKTAIDDVDIRITIINRGPEAAPLHVLPQLWFRNTWAWDNSARPELHLEGATVRAQGPGVGPYWLYCEGQPEWLFTDNDSNTDRLWGVPNAKPYVKDSINDAVVHGAQGRLNPEQTGTKCAAHYSFTVAPGATLTLKLRLAARPQANPFSDFDSTISLRQKESDQFYATVEPKGATDDERLVMRQAFAGLMWSKQYFGYDVRTWLDGDPVGAPPPPERKKGRNSEWTHLNASDIISMPDKWEYPWFAAWDLAFHCVPIALIDPDFAKRQLILMLREWYMHPNGQIPAYEWAFGDVNPPVHAWAALRVYKIEKKRTGKGDTVFLERVFQKLLLNFTWWVNRKDTEGRNIFQGGFLGLDNIGVFDRSATLPTGGYIEQADGTAWMGMFSLNMLAISLELARHDPAYEDMATKFLEHFMYIADAMSSVGGEGLWDDDDGFFYDQLHLPDGSHVPLKIRSLVGLIPLFGVETLETDLLNSLPRFKRRMQWFIDNRPDIVESVASLVEPGVGGRRLLSLVSRTQLAYVLPRLLDGSQFLSEYGIRALSKGHEAEPYAVWVNGSKYEVKYEPAESSTGLFGGNSNWRGPIWFPVNYLMIEALQKFHHYYGDSFKIEMPRYSDNHVTLDKVAHEISRRLTNIFLKDEKGQRPVFGGASKFQNDPNWRDYILFYEYFHGDNGAGIGASHQTGWTALVAKLIQQSGGGLE
jgi:Glycosyl hydrolase family 63 C-terminal domain